MTERSNPRLPIHAAHGTELTARSWQTEAPLRMLMNNLDPENAERPEDLVVYGGTGKAARNWESYDALVRTLTTLADDETMLVQSGKPVGVMRTHEWAPRVLIANSNLVGDWANWEEFRRLEDLGLTMYGQMTAGSWIYIGTQGILQGTFETFAAVADKRFGGTLAGTITVTAGLGGMGGAQPLAVTMNDGVVICIECDPARIQRRIDHRYLDVQAPSLEEAVRMAVEARDARRPLSIGVLGNAAAMLPAAARDGRPDRHRHRPDLGARPAVLPAGGRCLRGLGDASAPRTRSASPSAPRSRWPRTCARWSSSRTRAPRSSTTATRSATRRARAATTGPSSSRASCRRTSGRCSARARARSAGPRSPATRPTSPRPTGRSSSCSRTTSGSGSGSPWPASGCAFQGLPARICWLGYGERHLAGLKFNEMVASGELKAPIVIGRDHLDCGSVASPYRETEAMLDGSDAIADWAILNALVNTASGATWVSFHHGGGVGMGRSLHAGQVMRRRRHRAGRAEDRAGAHQRPGHGRDPARGRRLRPRGRGRRGARRADPDAPRAESEPGRAAWRRAVTRS